MAKKLDKDGNPITEEEQTEQESDNQAAPPEEEAEDEDEEGDEDEEADEEDEDEEEEDDDLGNKVQKAVAAALKAERAKTAKEREKARKQRERDTAKTPEEFKRLFEQEQADHEDTREELSRLHTELAQAKVSNVMRRFVAKKYPDLLVDADEYVWPRIERQISEETSDGEALAIVKSEVRKYAKRFGSDQSTDGDSNNQRRAGATVVRGKVASNRQPAPPRIKSFDNRPMTRHQSPAPMEFSPTAGSGF